MELTNSFFLDAPVEKVAEALCSEGYQLEVEKEREEVLSSRYRLVEQNEDGLRFEVRSVEYRRKMSGSLDRRHTLESVTSYRYDGRGHTLSWDYEGVGSEWVRVSGIYHLRPAGSGTEVEHRTTVRVSIPLVGERIARYVAGEMDKAFARFPRVLSRRMGQAVSGSRI